MNRTAGNFMVSAVLYGLTGFALGTYMGASGDMALKPVHSHLNLIGWITLGICAVYYQVARGAAQTRLSAVHFWLANAGMVVLTLSLALMSLGYKGMEAGAGIGSVALLASFAVFGTVVLKNRDAKD